MGLSTEHIHIIDDHDPTAHHHFAHCCLRPRSDGHGYVQSLGKG